MGEQKVKTVLTTGDAEVDEVLDRARDFWERFSKPIIIIATALIVVFGGWYIYKNFIVLPKEEKADDMIFPAENLFDKMTQQGFNKDSINLVLNGGGAVPTGVLRVINTYGGTSAG